MPRRAQPFRALNQAERILAQQSNRFAVRVRVEIAGEHQREGVRLLVFLHFLQQPLRAQHARFVKLVIQMRVVHVERLVLADGAQDGVVDDARIRRLLFKPGAGHVGRGAQPRNIHADQLVFARQEGDGIAFAAVIGVAPAANQRVAVQMLAKIGVHRLGDFLKADDVGLFGFQLIDHVAAAVVKSVHAVAGAFIANVVG